MSSTKTNEHQIACSSIRPGLLKLIMEDNPSVDENSYIAESELNKYRKLYMATLLKDEVGELSKIDVEVLDSISKNELLSKDIESDLDENITFGNRLSDKIAEFGGSWSFIISFFTLLFIWILINLAFFVSQPFDPYPFILLNLILSCIASIQAPLIMMSQNRKESKDRQRSIQDYKVNLKAELEVRTLNEKIDHLVTHQSQRLLEIQQMQMDLLEDIMAKIGSVKK